MDPFFTAKLRNYINVCTSDSSETPPAASTPEEPSTQVKQANQALDVSHVPTNLSPLKPGSRTRKAKEEVGSAVQQYESKKLKLDYPGTGLHKKAAVVKSALSQYNIPDLDPQMSEIKGEGPFDDTDSEIEEPKVSKRKGKEPADVAVAGLDQATNDADSGVPEPEADKNKGKEPTILTDIEEEDPVAWLDKRVEALKMSNASSTGIENDDSAAPIPKNWPPPSFINDMIAKYAGQQTHPPPKFALRPLPIEQATSSSTLPIESASSSLPTPSDLFPGFDPLALPQIPLSAADLVAENARLKAGIAQADALLALNTIERALSQPPIRRTRNSRTFESSAWTAFRLGRIIAGHAGHGLQQNPFQEDEMVRDLWKSTRDVVAVTQSGEDREVMERAEGFADHVVGEIMEDKRV